MKHHINNFMLSRKKKRAKTKEKKTMPPHLVYPIFLFGLLECKVSRNRGKPY